MHMNFVGTSSPENQHAMARCLLIDLARWEEIGAPTVRAAMYAYYSSKCNKNQRHEMNYAKWALDHVDMQHVTRVFRKNSVGRSENYTEYELFGCARALLPRCHSRGYVQESATILLMVAKRFQYEKASQLRAGAIADEKACLCWTASQTFDPKLELLENNSFDMSHNDPDLSELQYARPHACFQWSDGALDLQALGLRYKR